jgi:hypothetical protein
VFWLTDAAPAGGNDGCGVTMGLSDAEILAEASSRVIQKLRGPIIFTAPHGIECMCTHTASCFLMVLLVLPEIVRRPGWPNHAPERHTTEIAKLLADLCVIDGVPGMQLQPISSEGTAQQLNFG